MEPIIRTDVCIVGGGPGGSAAALQLAKRGVRATLIEKAVFPRDKVCGDALSGKVMRTLERLDPELARTVTGDQLGLPSWGVTFVAPSGRALRVPFSREIGKGEAPGVIMPRLDFDALLFEKVKCADGIDVLEGTSARSFTRTEHGWEIALEGSTKATLHCKIILAADGANSHFARHIAALPMEPRHHAAGVRAYYSGVTGLEPDGFIELIFLKDLLPGYLWVFPLPDGRANVGLGLRSDVVKKRRVDLKALMTKLIAEHPQLRDRFRNATLDGSIQGMGLPLASKRWPLSGDGYLLIGDAGHLIDPFTGEGISHAMISGVHAADVAVEALEATAPLHRRGHTDQGAERGSNGESGVDNSPITSSGIIPHSLLKAYDERVWKRLGKELAISTRLQQLADRAWLFDFVVDRANKNPALADTISCMFTDIDLRERLKKPGFYMDLMLGRATTKA